MASSTKTIKFKRAWKEEKRRKERSRKSRSKLNKLRREGALFV